MSRIVITRLNAWFALIIAAVLVSLPLLSGMAQSGAPDLTQTAEYDIGLGCPVSSALDPTGAIVWVLMDNCFQGGFTLNAFNVADGTPVDVPDYTDALIGMADIDVWVDPFITPMAFTPEGDLSIRYTNFMTYESFNIVIPLASGGDAITLTDADYDALLAEISEYPEYSVYSLDHTRVVATSATTMHVIDVQSKAEIAAIEIPVGYTDSALAQFSADGERLEVTYLNNPDAPDDYRATLLIYSLPDGALLHEYQMVSPQLWVSPDGAYAAVNLYSNNVGYVNELVVVDLATGSISAASDLDEAPKSVINCLNSGNYVGDVGYMTSGDFSVPAVHWLPDSSGLVLSLSYGGEAAGSSGSSCIFNFSRLRTYQVERAG